MKRRLLSMDPNEASNLTVALVERNPNPTGIPLVNSYAVGKYDKSDLVSLAQEIQKADSFVQATTSSKLQMIAEQVRFLQQQAKQVLLEAKENVDLHHAACNFVKKPGNVYYLYERPSSQKYFSMLSPKDWESQGGPPHIYIGAYRLERDMSWTPETKFDERSDTLNVIDKIIGVKSNFSITYDSSAHNDSMDAS
ncbi:uncharacterized protein C1orf50 homolog [Anabrus simplex]|uniref:uncharacterized protein C1orf50 homolog n=1 Tax=Anabrus simplex TaxID=316456 RepID=UPI0034DDB1CE